MKCHPFPVERDVNSDPSWPTKKLTGYKTATPLGDLNSDRVQTAASQKRMLLSSSVFHSQAFPHRCGHRLCLPAAQIKVIKMEHKQ